MARVDYYGIESAVKTLLEADSALTGVAVGIEEEVPFREASALCVEIYATRRDAPAEMQPIRAGKTTRFLLRLSIWCWAYSLESVSKACQLRDDLMGKVEIALMGDHGLGATVNSSWQEGGEFETKASPGAQSGFGMGGEIILVADVRATT